MTTDPLEIAAEQLGCSKSLLNSELVWRILRMRDLAGRTLVEVENAPLLAKQYAVRCSIATIIMQWETEND
jgi:hypothetical protein